MESIKDWVLTWLSKHWMELVMFKMTMIATLWLTRKTIKFHEKYHQFDYQMQMHSSRIDIDLLCRFKSFIESKRMRLKKKQHMLHTFSIKADNYSLLCLERCITVYDVVNFFEDIESLGKRGIYPMQVRTAMNLRMQKFLLQFIADEKAKTNFSSSLVLMMLESIGRRTVFNSSIETRRILTDCKIAIEKK